MGEMPSGPAAMCGFTQFNSLVIAAVVIKMGGIQDRWRTVRGMVKDPIALI